MDFNTRSTVVANNPDPTITLDPEALANISSNVANASEQIRSISAKIQQLSDSTKDGVWDGPDAEAYRQRAAELVKVLDELTNELSIDGAWAGRAGNQGQETIDGNVNMINSSLS